MTTQRRREDRVSLLIPGQIRPTGEAPITCVIRDWSLGGAGLYLSVKAELPDRFDLWMSSLRVLRPARLIWRTADRVGIAFRRAVADDTPVPI